MPSSCCLPCRLFPNLLTPDVMALVYSPFPKALSLRTTEEKRDRRKKKKKKKKEKRKRLRFETSVSFLGVLWIHPLYPDKVCRFHFLFPKRLSIHPLLGVSDNFPATTAAARRKCPHEQYPAVVVRSSDGVVNTSSEICLCLGNYAVLKQKGPQ